MHWAINVNGDRIEAKPNEIGFCPVTNQKLTAKCGSIKKWHWAHQAGESSEAYLEPDSEWREKWLSYYPENWQEVIFNRDNEKQVCDIATPIHKIFFANSTPTIEKIECKECFFGINLLWVINGSKFWDRIEIDKYFRGYWKQPRETWTFSRMTKWIDADNGMMYKFVFNSERGHRIQILDSMLKSKFIQKTQSFEGIK